MSAQRRRTETAPEEMGDGEAAPRRRTTRIEELEAQLDRLRGSLHIAVIGSEVGGTAPAITAAVARLGFRHVALLPDDTQLGEKLRRSGTELAWLAAGGIPGRNPAGHAAATLELVGVPYVGHTTPVASVLDNRHVLKRSLASLGIPTAPFITYDPAAGPFRPKVHSRFIRAFRDHWGRFVVSAAGGAAEFRRIVDDEAALPEAVATMHEANHGAVLIEAERPGRAYGILCCGRVTSRGRRLQRRGEPFTFAASAPAPVADDHGDPATEGAFRLLDSTADGTAFAQLHELAREAFIELGLETLVRWELRADAAGALSVVDAHGTPDLMAPDAVTSGVLGAGLAAHGMDYDDLVLSLLADRLDLLFTRQRGARFALDNALSA